MKEQKEISQRNNYNEGIPVRRTNYLTVIFKRKAKRGYFRVNLMLQLI